MIVKQCNNVPPQDEEGNDKVPQLDQFVNEQSFAMLDHLGWDKDDLQVFGRPFCEWEENQLFNIFLTFVNGSMEDAIGGMTLLNDEAERWDAAEWKQVFNSQVKDSLLHKPMEIIYISILNYCSVFS